MVYLDYSATTPTSPEVLESFNKATINYFANPNSLHKLGTKANELINASTEQIANILKVKKEEIIYTSGASESNNLAIKGVFDKFENRGKHIITTEFEHSSIYGPLGYLQKYKNAEVDFVETDEYGRVKLDSLEKLIRDDTILVSICSVNSEIGIRQPIEEIAKIVKKHPKCLFHVDMTQSIGKDFVSLENVDLASFSGHKIFGIKGIGVLIKKDNIVIEPLIHGGKSTTIYRSGTPALPLIVSLAKALRLATDGLEDKVKKIKELNDYLKENIIKYEKVKINSNEHSIPQILNLSVVGCKPETMQHALEEYDIYISTQTACSKGGEMSKAVYALTKDEERAKSSIRISISYVTTKEEIDEFLKSFALCYKKLLG
ncbi:MAG: cysteine desulfurase [Bacilli bacterium]|nr:cysteine desulfurase [Clostridia bacterium]MBR4672724.1 cysteine desulfurase [Bacilli bacterium]